MWNKIVKFIPNPLSVEILYFEEPIWYRCLLIYFVDFFAISQFPINLCQRLYSLPFIILKVNFTFYKLFSETYLFFLFQNTFWFRENLKHACTPFLKQSAFILRFLKLPKKETHKAKSNNLPLLDSQLTWLLDHAFLMMFSRCFCSIAGDIWL